jgi:hypothetical protein
MPKLLADKTTGPVPIIYNLFDKEIRSNHKLNFIDFNSKQAENN